MTSVHPIADDTIVQINEDGLRLSKREQEIEKQKSTESNRDQSNHDEITDKKQTKSTIQTINSKSDELNDEKIEIEKEVSNSSERENNPNQFVDKGSNLDETNVKKVNASNANESNATDFRDVDDENRRKNSISSKSSHSSSASSKSTSSTAKQAERDERLNRLNKEPSIANKDQTIFKPIINGLTNGLTNSSLLKSKEQQKELIKEQEQFTFTWSNLSYFVFTSSRFGLRKKKKFIFNKINGELKSNQLFGLLGPSGAG